MYSSEPTDDHIVFDYDMTSQGSTVSNDIMITQHTIVSDVTIHHQKVAIADPGDHAPSGRPRIERNELSNGVVVADDKLARLSFVLQILRHRTYRSELEYNISFAEGGPSLDHDVRLDATAFADLYRCTDD